MSGRAAEGARGDGGPAEVGQLIVVVDDDETARHSIGQMLRLRGWAVEAFSSAEAALAWPGLMDAVCIVTDVKMPGMDGEEFLAEVRARPGGPPVVMITGHGDIAMAVRCLKAGAFDFVEKPFDEDVLLAYVGKAVDQSRLVREASDLRRKLTLFSPGEDGRFGMVGRTRAMQDVYAQIEAAARSDAPVLITGETGVGKELVARAIHAQSGRARGPFVPVNAGALPETMLESELFGHARARSPAPWARETASSLPPRGAPCSWTRSRPSRCGRRSSCCACWMTAWWSRWAATAPAG